MTGSFLYSSRHEPAAPVIEIEVRRVGKGKASASLLALVDSGADASMLPLPLLEAIQARLIEKRRLVGVFGTAHTVDTYLVEIQIGPYVIRGIQAVAVYAGEDAVIGRDVLNQLVVTLDRPAETTLITD